jgi:hypothetical protein
MIVFATMHMSNSYMWVLLPAIIYFADVGLRWTLHATRATATATAVPLVSATAGSTACADKDVWVDALGRRPKPTSCCQQSSGGQSRHGDSCSVVKLSIPIADLLHANPGFDLLGEYLMIQAPVLGLLEWHPLSIAYVDDSDIHLLVKASGDWSGRLARLSLATSLQPLTCTKSAADVGAAVRVQVKVAVEGPYGVPITEHVVQQLTAGANVLLVAGGVGIASMIRTLQTAAAGLGGDINIKWRQLHLIWVVRSASVSAEVDFGRGGQGREMYFNGYIGYPAVSGRKCLGGLVHGVATRPTFTFDQSILSLCQVLLLAGQIHV